MAVNAKGVWLCCKYAITQMLTQEPLETASPWKDCEHRLGHGSHRRRSPFRPQRLKSCGSQFNAPVSGHFWSPANQCERPLSGIHPNSDDSSDKHRNRRTAYRRSASNALAALRHPKDVAQCVLFLTSSEAEWVTGAILSADGGVSAK